MKSADQLRAERERIDAQVEQDLRDLNAGREPLPVWLIVRAKLAQLLVRIGFRLHYDAARKQGRRIVRARYDARRDRQHQRRRP